MSCSRCAENFELYLQTRNKFRTKLQSLGLMEDDQDVFHIIAFNNGGSDHTDNFHFTQSAAWNRSIGDKLDAVNCYLAGRIKATKAVKISTEQGQKKSGKGKFYTGLSAEKLYKQGESLMRAARQAARDADELFAL